MEYKPRTGLIVTILILLAILATGVYYFYIKEPAPTGTGTNQPTLQNPFKPLPSTDTKNPQQVTTVDPIATSTDSSNAQPIILPKLRKLAEGPISGAIATSTFDGLAIRYVDRGLGHIYEILATSSKITKLSNVTVPHVYEAYWASNAGEVLLRYLRDEAAAPTDTILKITAEKKKVPIYAEGSASTTIGTTTVMVYTPSTQALGLSPLTSVISPLGKSFSIFLEGVNGVGYVSPINSLKKTKILDSPITGWLTQWPTESTITLTTKPLSSTSGYLFFLDAKTGSMKRILSSIKGLTTLTNSMLDRVLYAEYNSNTVVTKILNLKDNTTVTTLYKTLPEKCVWSKIDRYSLYCAIPIDMPGTQYPDKWYTGEMSFNDQVWYINTQTSDVELLSSPLKDTGQNLDAIELSLDPKEQVLIFTNKKDLSLWMIDLTR
ncbi:MAG: hypothetical protein V4526_02255 [Patescibacteria group bacterium]